MKDYLHEGIDLEKTVVVHNCEECGKYFEDDGCYQSYICPYCESGCTAHEHIEKEKWEEMKKTLNYEVFSK